MHCLVMLALFTPSPLEEWIDNAEREQLMDAARSYWVSLGVLEEDESYFRGTWALESDIDTMNWRLENTPFDAPPLHAHKRFPDANTCSMAMRQNRAFQRYLEHRRDWLLPGPEQAILDLVMDDTKARYKVWTSLYLITDRYVGSKGRRYDLHLLRPMIGPEAFEDGRMPCPLPAAAYREDWQEPDTGGLFQ